MPDRFFRKTKGLWRILGCAPLALCLWGCRVGLDLQTETITHRFSGSLKEKDDECCRLTEVYDIAETRMFLDGWGAYLPWNWLGKEEYFRYMGKYRVDAALRPACEGKEDARKKCEAMKDSREVAIGAKLAIPMEANGDLRRMILSGARGDEAPDWATP